MFVPECFPEITGSELSAMTAMGYAKRAALVMSKFLDDFTNQEIEECTGLAYNEERFRSPSIAPLHELYDGVYMLELWHGPTCAFKDMALQILPHLMRVSAKRTAGGKESLYLLRPPEIPERLRWRASVMRTTPEYLSFIPGRRQPDAKAPDDNPRGQKCCCLRDPRNFDDAQTGVKSIFTDPAIAKRLAANNMMFSSANSINWGRLLPQIVYYISSYCDLVANQKINIGDKINVVVPTGNFGNILAAYYSRKMGLPIARLICASNRNRVLTDFIQTGIYDRKRQFYTTSSPSMDILISSNLERLLYDISGCDHSEINRLMLDLKDKGRYKVSDTMAESIQSLFSAGWCDDSMTAQTIRMFQQLRLSDTIRPLR